MRVWLWVGALSSLSSIAMAQGYGLRVTPEGFDALNTAALARAPELYSTEQFNTVLADPCPGEREITGHVPPTDIALNFRDINLRAEDGRFIAGVVFDIGVATEVLIDNHIACFGEATCDITASVQRLGIEVELAAGTSPDGGIEFHSAMIDLNLTADDLNMESDGCIIGEIVTWLFDTFEDWALEMGIPRLEEALSERITLALNELFAETLSLEVQRDDLLISGTLAEVDLSSTVGLTAGGDVALEWTGATVWDDPSPDLRNPSGRALPDDFGPGMFQFAVSDKVVTGALYEAWRGGLIQNLLGARTTSLELGGDGVVQQIGLQAGTALAISMDIEAPLEVEFGRAAPNVATLGLNGLHVMIDVSAPDGSSSMIDLRVDGSMQAAIGVNDNLGGLVLSVEDLVIDQLTIDAGDTSIVADRARLASFVRDTITPMLSERLAGVPVAPALHSLAGTFIHVRTLSSDDGWQRVGVDMITPDASDTTAPDTMLEGAPTRIPAGTARFLVSGSDDTTPTGLIRYRTWLDGTPLAEGTASSVRALLVDVTDGDHVLEVAAVDLNENEDPTPARHEFAVDGVPPVLTMIESPLNILDGRNVVARWEASDDDGQPVASRWEVREIGRDGMTRIVGEAPFSTDLFAMDLGNLDQGELYELDVVVRDTAGNLTSQTFGFAVNPGGGGCATSAAGSSSMLWILGLALLVRRRRA